MALIGSTVDPRDPIAEAAARKAEVVQILVGDPQGWQPPTVAYEGGPAALRDAVAAAGISLYIHAAYVINVASTNNRIRIPSRKLLQQTVDLAAECGASGVVVHGGHVTAKDEPDAGFANWRKALDGLDMRCPLFIENTAGGAHAMARTRDAIARLWETLDSSEIGFCLDTCHAFAGGHELPDVVESLRAVTGRIDLVHANDSQGVFDSGRDRHANFGHGEIDPDALVATIAAAGAPVVCETPGEVDGQAADIAWLRDRLG
jgi:deoxyribonuclease IV